MPSDVHAEDDHATACAAGAPDGTLGWPEGSRGAVPAIRADVAAVLCDLAACSTDDSLGQVVRRMLRALPTTYDGDAEYERGAEGHGADGRIAPSGNGND